MLEFVQTFITDPIWSAIQYLTGLVFTDPIKRVMEWVTLLAGAVAGLFGWIKRRRGERPVEKVDLDTCIEALHKRLDAMQENVEQSLFQVVAQTLRHNLDGGIDTLREEGKEDALRDENGVAGAKALDAMIAARAEARAAANREDAILYRQKGAFAFLHDPREALAAYEQAVTLDPESLDGWMGIFRATEELGGAHFSRREFDAADELFQRQMQAAARIRDPNLAAYSSGNLGRVEFERGRLDEAEPLFRVMLDMTAAQGTKELEIGAAAYLSEIYQKRNQAEAAQKMQQRTDELMAALETRH